VTDWTGMRPNPSAIRQWWVLSVRVIAPSLRNGELLMAVSLSAVFTVSLYLPLKNLMAAFVHGSYAQYLVPVITLLAVYFSAMSAALRSSTDTVSGINRRFGTMPIAPMTPVAARMSGNLYRCATALATAILCGYLIGFRFYRSAEYTIGFCLLVMLIGFTLCFVGDLIGMVSKNPEAMTFILVLPAVILVMVSVGLQPADQFPGWLQPFVRNQPTSQFLYALRACAGDAGHSTAAVTTSDTAPALAWLAGMLVVAGPLYALAIWRRR
jgi:ABC-2 type transport system permease protein